MHRQDKEIEMTQIKNESVSVVADTDCKIGNVGNFSHLSTSSNFKSDNHIIAQRQKKSSGNCKGYSPDIFSQVKNALSIFEVLEYYGVEINAKDFALCPFHQEKTPSFKVNGRNSTFHCFGCGTGGTVIDFVMEYFNLTSIEAAKKLSQDFRLNFLVSENIDTDTIHQIQENKHLINEFKEWEKRAYKTLSSYFRALRFWGEQIIVYHCEYFNRYQSDMENIVFVEALVDIMIANTNDFSAQVEFYKTYRGAVASIERTFKQ